MKTLFKILKIADIIKKFQKQFQLNLTQNKYSFY